MDLSAKDIERFWSHVSRSGECWLWQKGKDKDGYGKFSYRHQGRKQVRAHRVAFFLANGAILGDALVCHSCDRPPCCNPDHLFQGSIQDNNADRNRKGRQAKGDRAGNHIHVERRPRAERHGRSKLNWEQVRMIRARAGEGAAKLASEFGVSDAAIWFILKGLHWKEAA